MKPKAKKFRIKRGAGVAGKAASNLARDLTDDNPVEQEAPQKSAAAGEPVADAQPDPSPQPADTDAAIDAIRKEGLTGRQLRMARRVAQKHKLPATSDFDAVRLLRERGIDPFQRSNMLELVVPKGTKPTEGAPDTFHNLPTPDDEGEAPRIQLPQTVAPGANLPGPELSPAERRTREISEIQRDIAQRRRRKLALLLTRLAFFVLLPTLIVGYFFYNVATPMYSTKTEFLILKAEGGGSPVGSLFSGTQFDTSQESIAVQSYLQSKDAMLRLDADAGFKAHFTNDRIDPIQRLTDNPSNEEAFKTFSKNIRIGYDPTEGVLRMEVTAADPQVAADFSNKLISYAEQRVNELSEKKRGDQMKDALEGFEKAQKDRRDAQEALVQLQLEGALLDPEGVIASLRGQITNVETQLQDKQLQLAALLDNTRPNQAKVDGARGDIRRLEALLDDLKSRMVDVSKGENSLAQLSVRLQMAQADLATRDMMLQSALQQVEQTRTEANRQVRYLTTSVAPVASQDPSYPRKFENTVLAFLIFSGIYLMLSLTASILREQLSN